MSTDHQRPSGNRCRHGFFYPCAYCIDAGEDETPDPNSPQGSPSVPARGSPSHSHPPVPAGLAASLRYLVAATEPMILEPGTVYQEFYHDPEGAIPGAYNGNFYLWCIKKAREALEASGGEGGDGPSPGARGAARLLDALEAEIKQRNADGGFADQVDWRWKQGFISGLHHAHGIASRPIPDPEAPSSAPLSGLPARGSLDVTPTQPKKEGDTP